MTVEVCTFTRVLASYCGIHGGLVLSGSIHFSF